jgi:hypothetical protein
MVYLYDACDQISDFCPQQLLRKMRRKISWTDRRTEVKQYTHLPLRRAGVSLYFYQGCLPTNFKSFNKGLYQVPPNFKECCIRYSCNMFKFNENVPPANSEVLVYLKNIESLETHFENYS